MLGARTPPTVLHCSGAVALSWALTLRPYFNTVVPGLRTVLTQFTRCYAGLHATDTLSTRWRMVVFSEALDVFRAQFPMAHR